MAISDIDKVLIIVQEASTDTVNHALLLASGARAHNLATDVMFSGGAAIAVTTGGLDDTTKSYLQDIKDAGGYIYVDQPSDGLWDGVKAVISLDQFKHHATAHTQIVTV